MYTPPADPYACVSFLNVSQRTEQAKATLCPTWDQTLLYDGLTIHGDPMFILEQPPQVVIEIFDHDTYVSGGGGDERWVREGG